MVRWIGWEGGILTFLCWSACVMFNICKVYQVSNTRHAWVSTSPCADVKLNRGRAKLSSPKEVICHSKTAAMSRQNRSHSSPAQGLSHLHASCCALKVPTAHSIQLWQTVRLLLWWRRVRRRKKRLKMTTSSCRAYVERMVNGRHARYPSWVLSNASYHSYLMDKNSQGNSSYHHPLHITSPILTVS